MTEEQRIIHVGQKYRLTLERAAGVKSGDGFKVEVNGDDLDELRAKANLLYGYAKQVTAQAVVVEQKVIVEKREDK